MRARLSFYGAAICIALACGSFAPASYVINGSIPITHYVTVQPVIVSNTDGSMMATFMGSVSEELAIKQDIDLIWSQAGIDIDWLAPNFWDDTFAYEGSSPPNTRPQGDLATIVNNGNTAGVGGPSDILTIYFVEIAPGFPLLTQTSTAGLAQLDSMGSTIFIGDNLPGFVFMGDPVGNQLVAKTIAHEIGHNLNLPHFGDDQNLMHASGVTPPIISAKLTLAQGTNARLSRFAVTAVPEPGGGILIAIAAVASLRRRR